MVLEAASLVRMYLSMAAWKSWMAWGMGVREGSRGLPGMWVAPVGSVNISPPKVTSSWMKISVTSLSRLRTAAAMMVTIV